MACWQTSNQAGNCVTETLYGACMASIFMFMSILNIHNTHHRFLFLKASLQTSFTSIFPVFFSPLALFIRTIEDAFAEVKFVVFIKSENKWSHENGNWLYFIHSLSPAIYILIMLCTFISRREIIINQERFFGTNCTGQTSNQLHNLRMTVPT